jgi:hypothetical protein
MVGWAIATVILHRSTEGISMILEIKILLGFSQSPQTLLQSWAQMTNPNQNLSSNRS